MWDIPGPGIEPISPALAHGFLSTAPPGKSYIAILREPIRSHILENLPVISGCFQKRWKDFHIPGGSDDKASAYNVGDPGSIPGSGRSSGERNGNPLQYSCLENPIDGGAF